MNASLQTRAIAAALSGHHPFGPSALHRRLACPGSLAAEIDLPSDHSVYAAEGTFAHLVLGDCLEKGCDAIDMLGRESQDGQFRWNPDDALYGQKYLDAVREQLTEDSELLVEQRLDLSDYIPRCYGTGDAVILVPSAKEIQVHDLKWGKGVLVDAEENPQLQAYALAAYGTFGLVAEFDTVRMFIHQPRVQQ